MSCKAVSSRYNDQILENQHTKADYNRVSKLSANGNDLKYMSVVFPVKTGWE